MCARDNERWKIAVRKTWKKKGKRKPGATFFDKIDCEEKAYWLGFFYADGTMNSNKRRVSLFIKETDRVHIEKFTAIFEREVKDYSQTCMMSGVNIDNVYVWDALFKLGMVPRKSWEDSTKVFDNIPEHLMNHFIRGLFDGDGCASFSTSRNVYKGKVYRETKSLTIGFTGTFLAMQKVSLILSEKLLIKYLTPRINTGKGFKVTWGGNKQIKNIVAPWIYKDATIFLERKKLIISMT
jgi:hypothetical protein